MRMRGQNRVATRRIRMFSWVMWRKCIGEQRDRCVAQSEEVAGRLRLVVQWNEQV